MTNSKAETLQQPSAAVVEWFNLMNETMGELELDLPMLTMLVVTSNRLDVLDYFLKLRADAGFDDRDICLWQATVAGNVETMEWLIDHGANVNTIHDDSTPMYCAIAADNIKAIELLQKRGVDVNTPDACGRTLISIAAMGGRIESMKCLERLGAR